MIVVICLDNRVNHYNDSNNQKRSEDDNKNNWTFFSSEFLLHKFTRVEFISNSLQEERREEQDILACFLALPFAVPVAKPKLILQKAPPPSPQTHRRWMWTARRRPRLWRRIRRFACLVCLFVWTAIRFCLALEGARRRKGEGGGRRERIRCGQIRKEKKKKI